MDMDVIDVKAIDSQIAEHRAHIGEHQQQIEMLESLKKLVADPKMRALIAQFSTNGKNGSGSPKSPIAAVVKEATEGGFRYQ